MMVRFNLGKSFLFAATLAVTCQPLWGKARQISDYEWDGVDRIVAVGDIHGDYDNYIAVLEGAGIIDRKGKWAAGETHLVQTGDIPDRGPDTQKIIDHIEKLAKQASRKGGQVHSLIGNHEAMNVYGDLRYVHEGEFKDFVTRGSSDLRDRYFDLYMKSYEQQDPEGFAKLSPDFRDEWNLAHPLGWVEHRQAWDPAWDKNAPLYKWVSEKPIAIRVNDLLFLHGGISGFYCQDSLSAISEAAQAKLASFDPANPGLIEDEFGPLWYRGLSGSEEAAPEETVDAILEFHKARHIVVGHTPTSGPILPRYGDRVIVIDTGIARHYGGHVAWLEVEGETLLAGYPGGKIPLPATEEGKLAYLEQVLALSPGNRYLQKRIEEIRNPPPEPAVTETSEAQAAETAQADTGRGPVPICGSSL